jgi:hypothetical protein
MFIILKIVSIFHQSLTSSPITAILFVLLHQKHTSVSKFQCGTVVAQRKSWKFVKEDLCILKDQDHLRIVPAADAKAMKDLSLILIV